MLPDINTKSQTDRKFQKSKEIAIHVKEVKVTRKMTAIIGVGSSLFLA
jgi:hypothetical protein